MEHSNNSHKCKHSWLASPAEANFLIDRKAGCVWVTSQHVYGEKPCKESDPDVPCLLFWEAYPHLEMVGSAHQEIHKHQKFFLHEVKFNSLV